MKKIFVFISLILLFTAVIHAEELVLNLLFSNDVHGGIDEVPATFINPDFPPPLGGGAAAAEYIKRVRAKAKENGEAVLLLDAGDFFQGHPIGTMTDGVAIIKYMNWIGYDAMAIGNHEFDNGYDTLLETLSLAEFPIVCANIIVEETGEFIPGCLPYILKDIDGITLGIIGISTLDTPLMSFPENIKGLKFLDAAEVTEKYIKIVKDEGADIVLVLGHMGIPYDVESAYQYDIVEGHINDPDRRWPDNAMHIACKVPGIDIFVAGHIHKGYNKPWEEPENHTLITQNYGYGSNIGHLVITIDTETKSISGWEVPAYIDGSLITLFGEEFIGDPWFKQKIDSMQAVAEKGMDEIVGFAGMHLSRGSGAQSIIGNVVMDAMLEETDADFAFLNLGGVRDDIEEGPVSYRDIFDVLPFESEVITMKIPGSKLKEIIEVRVAGGRHGLRVAGGEVEYSKKYPDFQRVTDLKIGGEPWDPDKIYTVATTDFLMQGNSGLTLLTEIPEKQITYKYIILRDALANYFRRREVVNGKIDNRWIHEPDATHSEVIKKHNQKKDQLSSN
ncbi:MAG TPA: bifunctional metallophosphatase/5'-nucleotidase [Candidatus Cloacimonetes bacterium]|nr:bifunctional metallophosphatase/5'-nucleotidase [Candidatus Cloacimonadota bacterium]HEX38345.1 bifunctional metallophosphatase/5'-nucleotidase [Candidatus Cloacimonadota bacterium]